MKVNFKAVVIMFLVTFTLLVTRLIIASTYINLGASDNFAILGSSSVTNIGDSIVNGNLGVSPGSGFAGFPPGVLNGTLHLTDSAASDAQTDLTLAISNAAGQPCISNLTDQDLGGKTLAPGVYCFDSSAGLTGTLILDGGNDPNALYIFQIGTTLITTSSSIVNLTGSTQACNVFWNVGSSATLGTSTSFQGNILAYASITLNTSASITGRLLASTGAVTLDTNVVTKATCATPPDPPSGLSLNTPSSSPGNITTPIISVAGVVSGDTVRIFTDNTCTTSLGSAVAGGTSVNVTSSALTQGSYIYKANSTNPLGLVSDCSTATVEYVLDTTEPTTAVIIANNSYNLSSFIHASTINGTAADTGGGTVTGVQITIQRSSDSQYWTGSIWSATETWINVTSGTTTWDYTIDDTNFSNAITYTVLARATDSAGNTTTSGFGSDSFIYYGRPIFTISSEEVPSSDVNSPITVSDNIDFQGTVTDPEGNQYYFIVCKTGTDPTVNSLAAPSCNGGNTNQLCISGLTNSTSQASCTHDTTGETSASQDWYAFGCTYSTMSLCTALDQGSGSSGSPYFLNNPPTFTLAPTRPSANPGGSLTFTVLSTSWNDADNTIVADTGKLIVCNSSGLTLGGVCVDTQLCASSLTATGSNLECSFNSDAVKDSGVYNAYTYIVDNHNLGALGAVQGTNVEYTINNVAPTVSDVTINGGNEITLTANSTTEVGITANITDMNGCTDLATNPASSKLYRSSIGYSSCNSTNSSCYIIAATSCAVDTAGTLDTCTGGMDSGVRYKCSVNLEYFTDPTDETTLINPYADDTWISTVTATDQYSLSGSLENIIGVEVNSLNAIQITNVIDYGNLSPNITSGSGLINIPLTITNVGNVGLDAEVKGNSTGLCTNYPTCTSGVIPLIQQKWEYTSNSISYSSSTSTLTGSFITASLAIKKPTLSTNPTSGNIYWGVKIPLAQNYGAYTGENTINSKISVPADW